jgi:exosortase A
MSSGALAMEAAPDAVARSRRAAWLALSAGLAALLLLFRAEAGAAVHVWIASTAYNHCFLVAPIAGFLAWERRARLPATAVRPSPGFALLALPLGAAWLAAERLGVMEGRQLAALGLVQVLVLAVAGGAMWRAFAGPLLYLFFLVPFGAFITPQLQDFTSHFTTAGLDLLGIPNYSDGHTIEIPQGTFYVAEACAGLRFLIASVAFGALYALMMYRSPIRRLIFFAVSIVVPVIANGFRALGIVWLGHELGSAQAAATDHVLYGWIFFSLVILALTLLGLPFRQDAAPPAVAAPPAARGPARPAAAWAAALAVAAAAALAPAAATALSTRRVALAAIPDPPSAGCARTALDGAALAAEAPAALVRMDRFDCGGAPLVVRVLAFPPTAGASAVIGARRALTQPLDAEDVSVSPLTDSSGRAAWRLTEAREPFTAFADLLWIGDRSADSGLALRLGLARASLLAGDGAPVLIVVSPAPDAGLNNEAGLARSRAAIVRFLNAADGLPSYARALSRAAAQG